MKSEEVLRNERIMNNVSILKDFQQLLNNSFILKS